MPWANYFKAQMQKRAEEKEQKQISSGTCFKFDQPVDPKNKHYAFAEELTVPFLNHCDAQRCQMYSSHITQAVHLVKPEFPKVFTNFENQVGEYSIAYKKASNDFKIIAKLQKNALNYDLIIQYTKSGIYDVIHYRRAKHITEEYGYGVDDCLSNKSIGDTVKKDEFIYKAPNYDDDGNFAMGSNLKAVFLCWKNLTYEDPVVISKSAAEKLTSYKVEESIVSVNTNDILLNIYSTGQNDEYHSFPHVGEHTLDNVLVASRREDNQTLLYNFQYDKTQKINPGDDITYTNGGIIADIDIYCNMPIDQLRKRDNQFTQEVVKVLEAQNYYYENAAQELEKILPTATEHDSVSCMTPEEKTAYYNERKEYGFNWTRPVPKQLLNIEYTEEFGYFWKQVHEYLDGRIQWKTKGKTFQNFKIKFTVLKENKLTVGCKITGRYGNKGVVSLIEHDENMPTAPDGTRAEIILNPLGVFNRMNPAQTIEQEVNFISDHVVKIMKTKETANEKYDLFMSYLKYVDPSQYNFIDTEVMGMNRSQKIEFIQSLMEDVEKQGIYIHEAPFFNNTSHDTFRDAIVRDHPEWCQRYKCEGIERPIVIGDIYFIRLKHEASNKTSFVSADTTNTKDQPSKSNMKKTHKTLYANTPIRFGEMECDNLLLTKDGKSISKILKSYSTSKTARVDLIKKLLTTKDPFNTTIDIEEDDVSINRKILDKYLSILELSLDDSKLNEDDE